VSTIIIVFLSNTFTWKESKLVLLKKDTQNSTSFMSYIFVVFLVLYRRKLIIYYFCCMFNGGNYSIILYNFWVLLLFFNYFIFWWCRIKISNLKLSNLSNIFYKVGRLNCWKASTLKQLNMHNCPGSRVSSRKHLKNNIITNMIYGDAHNDKLSFCL